MTVFSPAAKNKGNDNAEEHDILWGDGKALNDHTGT